MASKLRIVVAGAGAIGCFLGGLLAAQGHQVTLLMRPRGAAEIRTHGLTLTDYAGLARRVSADELGISEDAVCLEDADIVLVTVRSVDTGAMATLIAQHASPQATVVSLQGSPEDTERFRMALPDADLRAGFAAFQVVPMGQGCFYRETNGEVFVETGPRELAALLRSDALIVNDVQNIVPLHWGRFLIRLNDGLNALSGLPLRQQLGARAWRALIAAQWREAARVLKARGITPVLGTATPIGLVRASMYLPTAVFTRAAGPMMAMDAQARTPMAHDLILGKPTEIVAFQGRILELAQDAGIKMPITTRVHELVKLAEVAAEGLPHLPVTALRG